MSSETLDGGGAWSTADGHTLESSLDGLGSLATAGGTFVLNPGFPAGMDEAPPPTAARVVAFDARWLDTARVLVTWQMGVEVNCLGFLLQRRSDDGPWITITPQLIPAEGAAVPKGYYWEDTAQDPAAPVAYRLLETTTWGETRGLAESPVRPGIIARIRAVEERLTLAVSADAETKGLVESAPSVIGPWTPIAAVELDGSGRGEVSINREANESGRFFRVRLP